MSKKSLRIAIILTIVFVSVTAPTSVFAAETVGGTGITPKSRLYFLDTLTESVKNFFTFSPEKKAQQQLDFVEERLEEKQELLDDEGVASEKLEVVDERLQQNLDKTTRILEKTESQGKDATRLSDMLSTKVEQLRQKIEEQFGTRIEKLDTHTLELENQLREAKAAGNEEAVEQLTKQLEETKQRATFLEKQKEDQVGNVEQTQQKIEGHLSLEEEVTKKIRRLTEQKNMMAKEFTNQNVTPPAGVFENIQALLDKAQAAAESGDHETALAYTKEAEKARRDLEKTMVTLLKITSKEQQLKNEIQAVGSKYQPQLQGATSGEATKVRQTMQTEQKLMNQDLQKTIEERRAIEKKVQEYNQTIQKELQAVGTPRPTKVLMPVTPRPTKVLVPVTPRPTKAFTTTEPAPIKSP